MVTDWSDEQRQNAEEPIVLTEFEMVTDWSHEQRQNAKAAIDVFPGLGIDSIYLYFFFLSS